MKVEFHENEPRGIEMSIVIIASRYRDKWILVKHKERSTYEIPAGHIEPGEDPSFTAKRELYEETGASDFSLEFLSYYTITKHGKTSGGYLFFAEVHELLKLPDYEIANIGLFDGLPDEQTYPLIQPVLFDYVLKHIKQPTM